jgi:osmoprotectant transport system permease protein
MSASTFIRDPLLWLGLLFLALATVMPVEGSFLARLFPAITPSAESGDSFFVLWLYHAALVAVSSAVASGIGILGGIVATRRAGGEFRPLLQSLATIGQTFPPVAVLALAVPAFGYGAVPTFIALALYGILPVFANTLAGLASVPAAVREAARGMGLTRWQILASVELPLAAPLILAGIRTSVIINIGTATIGSTVGAVTLGAPILEGLVTNQLADVIQGAILVGFFAILSDLAFARLERALRRFAARD